MSVRDLGRADVRDAVYDAEICVVGAGIAGLLAGSRLARAGRKVIVLESGGRGEDPDHAALNMIKDTHGYYGGATAGRRRALGGTSSLWGGRMLPLTHRDMSSRPELGILGWPITPEHLQPYGREVESLFGLDEFEFEDNFLREAGFDDPFHKDDPDFLKRFPKWPDFRKCNVALLLHREIEMHGGIIIWTDATVCGFQLNREVGHLAAVEAVSLTGNRMTVRAREFVLAAGTIESTRLMLWLDACSDGHALKTSDAAGRYFQDHVSDVVGRLHATDSAAATRLFGYYFVRATRRNLHFEMTPAAQIADRVANSFVQIAIQPSENSPLNVVKNFVRGLQQRTLHMPPADIARLVGAVPTVARLATWRYAKKRLYLPEDTDLLVSIVAEQIPQADNRIVLDSRRDRTGVPIARLDWQLRDPEFRTFRSAASRIGEYWARSGLHRLCPIEWLNAAVPGDVVARRGLDVFHPSGSLRMGSDPRTSVVDEQLRCHAVENVTVCSAAVFPTSGAAGPTYTLMCLALRAADAIQARIAGDGANHTRAKNLSAAVG